MAELDKLTKDYIREYVAAAADEDEAKSRRRECAESYGVSLMSVAAITAHTKIQARKQQTGQRTWWSGTPGAVFNYDSPIKQKYRVRVAGFTVPRSTPDWRRKAKVLLMPGVRCLEIPVWLEAGYLAENIVGVEGDKDSYGEFCYYASKYGIGVRTCDLSKVVGEEEWGVVHMDMTGPVGYDFLECLFDLNMAPFGFFAGNLLKGREGDKAKEILDFAWTTTMQAKAIGSLSHLDGLAAFDQIGKANSEKLKRGELLTPEVKVGEKRDIGVPFAIQAAFCKRNRPNYRTRSAPDMPAQFRDNKPVQKCATLLMQGFWRFWAHNVGGGERNIAYASDLSHKLLSLYAYAMNPHHLFTDIDQTGYTSPNGQAFITEIYQAEIQPLGGSAVDHVIKFVNDAVVAIATNFDRWDDQQCGFRIRRKAGYYATINVNSPANNLQPNDTIELHVFGQNVASVQVRTLVNVVGKEVVYSQRDVLLQALWGKRQLVRETLS